MDIINIGNRREVFWDDYLIDTEKTTATHRVMNPVKREVCFEFDQGTEKSKTITYPCIVKADNGYKMYYLVWRSYYINWNDIDMDTTAYLCVLESEDGVNWTRPDLDITCQPEYEKNNVILDHLIEGPFVFYDESPNCKKGEEYKLVTLAWKENDDGKKVRDALWCWVSGDGIHFEKKYPITGKGAFDSMNTIRWHNGRYACYMRGFENGIRDVRVCYSHDFTNWSEPEKIKFDDDGVYQLYTNNVMPYERAPHLLIGFPTRYNERREWTANNDQIGSCELKKIIINKTEPRGGLATTDCIFMSSRDGLNWHRNNEAFLTAGIENEYNWVYGDCYLTYNLVDSGADTYYLYSHDRYRNEGMSKLLSRYEIRKDGFACIAAGGEEKVVVTKPITFDGSIMHLNFETSAYGYIYVEVLDENGATISDKRSFEIFGNNIDRKITFADGSDFSQFAGKPVRLKFIMRDAKLYSFKFD